MDYKKNEDIRKELNIFCSKERIIERGRKGKENLEQQVDSNVVKQVLHY
jgi:hypothetical protein